MKHSCHGKHALSITASVPKEPVRKSYPIYLDTHRWGCCLRQAITIKQALAFAARLNKAARLAAALASRPLGDARKRTRTLG